MAFRLAFDAAIGVVAALFLARLMAGRFDGRMFVTGVALHAVAWLVMRSVHAHHRQRRWWIRWTALWFWSSALLALLVGLLNPYAYFSWAPSWVGLSVALHVSGFMLARHVRWSRPEPRAPLEG